MCLTEGVVLDCPGFFSSSEKRFSCIACRHPKENIRASYTLQQLMSGEQHCGVLMGNVLPVCGSAAAKGRSSILLIKVDDIASKQKMADISKHQYRKGQLCCGYSERNIQQKK